jgi:tetratricopeptide (TPR) repeat protein
MPIEHRLIGRLPEPVRVEAARHFADDDLGSLVSLIDDHLAGAGAADPAALLTAAWARTRLATEVMFDSVVDDAEKALREVAAARAAGAVDHEAATVERYVRTALTRERNRRNEADEAEETAETAETAEQLQERAHRERDAGRPEEAAALFQRAARLRPDGAFNNQIRAGLCLAEAGRFDEAEPVLELALVYDWAGAGIWNDRHMSEHAARALLRHAARSGAGEFDRMWRHVVECCQRLSWPFPSIHPVQDEMLGLTIQLGLREHCRHVLATIRARRGRIDDRTRARIAAAEAFLA